MDSSPLERKRKNDMISGGSAKRRDEEEDEELSKKEKRHMEFMLRLDDLQMEFLNKRERIYIQKLSQFRTDLLQLQSSTHPELLASLHLLSNISELALLSANLQKEYLLSSLSKNYEDELHDIESELKREKEAIKASLMADLNERKMRIKEEVESFDIDREIDLSGGVGIGAEKRKRKLPRAPMEDKKRKKVPGINPLKIEDVEADLIMIRKGSRR
ncbi:hypothetical protein HK098_000903 [Nowakowskiella sp. JEL0407]|nr:hypothetical protein HK098_000903 [Nowakowskiella sp. JEL0407]